MNLGRPWQTAVGLHSGRTANSTTSISALGGTNHGMDSVMCSCIHSQLLSSGRVAGRGLSCFVLCWLVMMPTLSKLGHGILRSNMFS